MSFQEEDEWLGLGQGFVLDDAFKCTSPLGADNTLQVPLREPSPIPVSPQDLMDFSFPNDNSLSLPIREYGFQGGNEPPRLSPVSSSYQSMAPLQNVSYELSTTSMVQEDSYNSFEQPSIVVNGHYQTIEQQIIQPQQGYYQAVPDVPHQQVVSTPHTQHSSTPSGSTSSGSVVQQILNAPSARQTPTPQQQHPSSHPRQRPIQPKAHNNGRKRASVNSHSGLSNKSTKVDSSTNNSNQTEVRFSMSALTRITEIGAEMAQLQEQQDKLGINNSQRLSELQAQRASILLEALSSQNVGETVLSQVKQVAAAAAPTSQPRPTARSRGNHGHSSRQQHFENAPESPQYQPQMYLASHNQYPSTSTAQFQEFTSGNVTQAQIVHQQDQVTVHRQPQQRVYRTQNAGTAVFHATSQLPPGTVYVQNVPQASQAQFASNQPTVGEVVRQQHQLRQVSGAHQVIVQQVAAPQMVVTSGGQPVSGAQIRTQIVQQSSLPAQIVLAPASVQQTPQMVVVAQRSTPAQTAKRLEEKRAGRLSRLRSYFDNLHDMLANPDTETPFTDLRDVLQRLLPYHAYGEPSFSEEHLEQFDSNYLRTTINLMEQRKRLEKRLRKVFFDEAMRTTEVEERNLLLFLDGEYAKRKLEEEKEFVKQGNLELFVRDSPIVAALRNSDQETLEKARAASASSRPSCSKSVMQQYEYHPFDEIPLAVSPYKSPSPFKSPASSIRSPSPCKSPASIPYSPRIRARKTSLSQHPSPAQIQEPMRTRTTSKSRTTSETTPAPSEKPEVVKTEPVRPVPPPLPTAASRRVPPSSPITTLAARKGPPSSPIPTLASRRATPSRNAAELKPVVKEEITSVGSPAAPGSSRARSKTPQKTPEPPPTTSTPGRLPAKKEILSRARQGVPVEMRSPPAHTSIAASSLFSRYSVDDYESDGSASPELGVDDVISQAPPKTPPQSTVTAPTSTPDTDIATQPTPTSSVSKSQAQTSAVVQTPALKRIPIPPPPHRLPSSQRSTVPQPPPLPQRKEKVMKTPERTASPMVKQENVRPVVKQEEEKPAERFRFKPQVPRPTPVSPLKPTAPKRETPVEVGLPGKDVNSREIRNHLEENENVPVANCVKPPPIRLKVKFDGAKPYIENNENSEKDGEKKHRKHKKKKKERDKEHKEGHIHVKVKHRTKGDRKHKKKKKEKSSPQELVAVTKNGKRLKVKFGLGGSDTRSSTPNKLSASVEISEPQPTHQPSMHEPSTSKASAVADHPKVPRLRIRIGDSPALVIAPPKADPPQTALRLHSPAGTASLDGLAEAPKGSIPVQKGSSNPLAVEFSDDSDTEAERIRSATDEALRGLSNLTSLSRANATWEAVMAEQVERAFLKQPTINLNNKARLLAGNKKVPRYVRNIGLGFKTPREASEGTYIDKKCPWTGNCSIRGNILTGVVLKNKMTRTIVVRRDYLHFVKKYRRFEKRHKNVPAHCSPAFRDIAPGDLVTIGECRPLSKTVRFNVLKVNKAGSTKKGFAKF
ncbi:hypothetical protein RB195_002887 [Necator americanus]|uniref:Small ribosomal subunit protein uS17 n=1 Tax=Necator americanus TaxID=51031 RepID=A0ABR1DMH9_NECAM